MGPKNGNSYTIRKRKREVVRTITELKEEIIAKFENGVRISDLASQYGMAKSMILTFLKNEDVITAADVAKGVTSIVRKQRSQIIDKVEKLFQFLNKSVVKHDFRMNYIRQQGSTVHTEI